MEVDTRVVVCWTIMVSSSLVSTEDRGGFKELYLTKFHIYFMSKQIRHIDELLILDVVYVIPP